MKKMLCFFAIVLAAISCKEENIDLPDGLYAKIDTDKGTIITTLEYEKSPVTVANFVTLAEGKNPFVSEKYKGKPFFDGLTFHRVEDSFMIQGGDPDANGSGGPGYRFKDEFSNLTFARSGVLAMANAGPGTNGSQFFITHVPTEFLDGKHTIFGFVTGDGMETVNAIEVGDAIKSIAIIRKGEAAKKFDALKIFNNYATEDLENRKKQEAEDAASRRVYAEKFKAVKEQKAAEHAALKFGAEKSRTGLYYKTVRKGNGKPKTGTEIKIRYAGYLEDGTLADTNVAELAKIYGIYNAELEKMGRYEPMRLEAGHIKNIIPGLTEAIKKLTLGERAVVFIPSALGYGPQGAGNVIPPGANLIFEIELEQ